MAKARDGVGNIESVEVDVSGGIPHIPDFAVNDGDLLLGGAPGGVWGELARVKGVGGAGDKLFFVVLAECVVEADEADSKVDTIGALKDGYVDSILLLPS